MTQNFSKSLLDFRLKHGLTQREMAERLGISLNQYANYENGKTVGTPKKIAMYLERLHGKSAPEAEEDLLMLEVENLKESITLIKKDVDEMKTILLRYLGRSGDERHPGVTR